MENFIRENVCKRSECNTKEDNQAMTTFSKPMTVRLPDDLYKFVKGRAKRGHTKMSEAVRVIVRKAMADEAKKAAEEKS